MKAHSWVGLAVRLLGPALLLATAIRPAPAQQLSAFPPPCVHLVALARTTANGPEDESRFDTERIQSALDLCPAGEAVELEPTSQGQNAFLTAPLHLPPGVTLLIDAGVTLFASRRATDYRQAHAVQSGDLPCGNLPCRALIAAADPTSSYPAGVDGFGTVDGRGSLPLLDSVAGTIFWADFGAAERPDLIHAKGRFELHKLTLRDAPATALTLSGQGTVNVVGAKFVASTDAAGTRGIVQTSPSVTLNVAESSFTQSSSSIETVAPDLLTLNGIQTQSESQLADTAPQTDASCISIAATHNACTPTALPLYIGEVFLSSAIATNLVRSPQQSDLLLHVVLSATRRDLPPGSGSVTIYDGSQPLGTTTVSNGLATFPLTPLNSHHVHVLTAHADSSFVSFGSGQAVVGSNISTVAISANTTRAAYNTPIDLLAEVTPASATGLVSFYDGQTLLGQSALASGTATLTANQLNPGTHTLTARYGGDSANAAAVSPPLTVLIDQAATACAFSGFPRSAPYGSLHQAFVTVSPASATGSISLTDTLVSKGQTQQSSLGSANVSNGSASFSLGALAVGTHTLSATFSGDQNYVGSSTASTLTINSLPTTLALSTPRSTLSSGSPTNFSATLSPGSGTGTVVFHDSISGVLGQAAVINGSAVLGSSALSIGVHSIYASYSGDANNDPSVSPSINVTVERTSSSLLLAPLPAMLAPGAPLSLAATLTPQSGTGVVTFTSTYGIILGQSPVISGNASVTTTYLSFGTYSIVATYSGDSATAPSTSTAQTIEITGGSSVSLSVSAASASYGTSVTLSAQVAPTSATGFVAFSDATLGALGSVPLGSGHANLNISNLVPGIHTLKAIYSGDSSHPSSTSGAISLHITPANTSTVLTLAQTTLPAGSPIVCNLQVNSLAAITPTGTVQVMAGKVVLASGQLFAGPHGTSYASLTIPSTTLGLGNISLSATYNGDSFNAASTTGVDANLTVTGASTQTSLTVSATQLVLNSSIVLTAHVATSDASGTPTGSVSFMDNNLVVATVRLGRDGSASTQYSPVHTGLHALSATYLPGGTFAASASGSTALDVTLPVSLALTPTAITATAQSTETATLTITPLSGYSGSIQTTCSSPAYIITCAVDAPSTIQHTPVQTTVQITIAKDLASNVSRDKPGLPLGPAVAVASLLPLISITRKAARPTLSRSQGLRVWALLAAALIVTGTLSGCALGGNFFTIPSGPQDVTVTVAAAGTTVSASMQVNITQ